MYSVFAAEVYRRDIECCVACFAFILLAQTRRSHMHQMSAWGFESVKHNESVNRPN
jgi:hypothetical protein